MPLCRRRLLAHAGVLVALPPQAHSGGMERVSLAELGLRPDSPDAAPFFKQALQRLRPRGGVLHIPPGRWRFTQTDGAAVAIDAIDDLIIEGDGAVLMFEGRAKPFVIHGCRAPMVRGFAIDWVRPPFSQGVVVGVGGGNQSADIAIDPGFPVDGSETVGALATYERSTGLMARGGLDAYDVVDGVTLVAPQRLRLSLKRLIPLRTGDTVVLRHALYGSNALSFTRCTDIVIQDVTIRTAPGMAVYADRCSNAVVQRLEVAPPPGSSRLMTTTADALHFDTCTGRIDITGCTLAAMGDDGVNVHGRYQRIAGLPDRHTLTLATPPDHLAAASHPTPVGDQLEVLDSHTLGTVARVTIHALDTSGPDTASVAIEGELPPEVQPGDYVLDASMQASVTISHCHFPGNRARGVLVHNDAVIHNCRFTGQTAEAILLLPDFRYLEGPEAERVTIRDNDFADVMRLGHPSGAIRIDVAPAADGAGRNHGISILGNRFTDVGGPALLARHSTGVTFVGNHIQRCGPSAVAVRDVRDVQITDNTCVPGATIAIARGDEGHVTQAGNTGLSEAIYDPP